MEDQGFSECEPSRWIRGARSVAPPCSFAVSRKPAAHGDGCVSRDVKVRASTWLTVVRHEDGSAIAWLLPLPAATYRGAFAAGTRRRRGCWLAPCKQFFATTGCKKKLPGRGANCAKHKPAGIRGAGNREQGARFGQGISRRGRRWRCAWRLVFSRGGRSDRVPINGSSPHVGL